MCLDFWLAKSVEIVSFHKAKYKASHYQEREVLFLPDFLPHVKIWLMVPFLNIRMTLSLKLNIMKPLSKPEA